MSENKTTLSRVQIHNLEGLWICILCGKMDSDSASYYADRLDRHQIPWHVQNHIASTAIYKAIDSICNILLVFSIFALVILAFAHQAQLLTALSN